MRRLSVLMMCLLLCFVARPAESGELIAFSGLADDGYWQLWTVHPDGSNLKQITTTPYDKRDPGWFDHGRRLAYRTHDGRLKVLLAVDNPDAEEELLAKYHKIANPVLSPDGSKAVFVRFDPMEMDVSEIWLADLPGEEARLLTRDKVLKYQPALSADGQQIAFVQADRDGSGHQIWVMDAAGENRRTLTDGTAFNSQPAFSPDGATLLFSANRDSETNYDIFRMDVASGNIEPLTSGPGIETAPVYSPDGRQIAYVAGRDDGRHEIRLMDIDGSNDRPLLSSGQEAVDPAWTTVTDQSGG